MTQAAPSPSRPPPRGPARAAFVAAAAACAHACAGGGADVWRDLPVEIDGDVRPAYLAWPPEVVAGVLVGGQFRPLADGDALVVIRGLQGGRWVHVSVRARGLDRRGGMVTLRLRREGGAPDGGGDDPGGAVLGERALPVRLAATADGWLLGRDLPVPVPLSDGAIAALAGTTARLWASYATPGGAADTEVSVVLRDE